VRTEGDGVHVLRTPAVVRARWVVNAAGLEADRIDALFGHTRFTTTPRRGELIVFDKLARPLVRRVILPVPTATTKGVLVAPTVFGNVVLGPTAADVPERDATDTTEAGLAALLAQGRRILPALAGEEVTSTYAGLRAATASGDYRIHIDGLQRYVCVGGIRSTGLTASLAIAEHVAERLAEAGLVLRPRAEFRRVRMPNLGEQATRPYQDAACIAAEPAFGRIVCHCERVTEGEILAATRAPVPARSLDGVRRRTRALLGRCQGFYCAAEVARLVAKATGRSVPALFGLERS
jgi:glycerol-3-phosphate dehydrogenase